MLLDRLAVIGLGSPLYSTAASEDQASETSADPVAADPDRELMEQLMRLRRRPARLADQLTRQYRESRKPALRPGASSTATLNGETAATLAHAEELGREIGKARRLSRPGQ